MGCSQEDQHIGEILGTFYPECFDERRRPLKIGILDDVREAHPTMDLVGLDAFLKEWTSARLYLENVRDGHPRVDLQGREAGHPSIGARRHSARMLGGELPRGGRSLPAHARAKRLRDGGSPGEEILGEDLEFVIGLLRMHPDGAAKTAGMTGIRIVKWAPGQNALAIVRTDGSAEPFSVRKCLAARPHVPGA